MKNINVFGYATFGTPNGFTQSCIHGNKSLENVLKKFDLKSDAIQLLSPNDRIYSIRKEFIQNDVILSYSFYTYLKEKNSNRGGTFIGTSLVFTNEILPENLTLKSLHEIHSNLNQNNVDSSNFVLNVNHSKDFNLQNIFSKDFEKLEHQTNKVNFLEWENSGKNLVILTTKFDHHEIQNLYKKSLQILPKYDTIFFIDSKEIAEFVAQKRLFRIIDVNGLDQEIQILQEERKQKITNAIARFEREKLQFEEERKRVLEDLQKQIAHNQQKHSENGKKINEASSNLNNLNTLYQRFSKKFDELISGLNSDKKLEEINNSYKEYKRNFEEEKRKLENISSIQSLPNSGIPFNSSQGMYSNNLHQVNEDKKGNNDNKDYVVLLISVIINIILIIGAIAYFTIFHPEVQDKSSDDTNQEQPITQETFTNSLQTKLNPIPDTVLVANDYKLVAKQLKSNMKIKEVIEIIFDKNKTEIKDFYSNQKDDYSKLLFEKNPKSFNILSTDTIFTDNDSLKIIPSIKIRK